MFNSEIFNGNILGSLTELIESKSFISVDDVKSSSILGSAGGGSVVAGRLNCLWSELNIGNKEIALLGHSSWSVESISSGLSDMEWLLSLLKVVDSLGGGGINSEWLFNNDILMCTSSNKVSVSVSSNSGGGEV